MNTNSTNIHQQLNCASSSSGSAINEIHCSRQICEEQGRMELEEDIQPKKSAIAIHTVVDNGENVEIERKSDGDDTDADDDGWQTTDVVEWKSTHVQAWMKTLGPRVSRLSSMFSDVTGTDLLLFKCKEDLAAKMPGTPKINAKIFFRKINKLRTERNIDESVVQAFKSRKKPGIIGLGNIGNTCFMNSSIQVLLQTPRLMSYLRNYAESNNNNNTNTGSMLFAVSQLSVHARNSDSQHEHARPHAINSALKKTNPQMCDGGPHDSFECLSSILHALDEDIHEYILRNNKYNNQQTQEKPKLILEKRNVQPFTNDAKEKMFVEQMFKKFNPYESAVRSAMNGILRKKRTCYSCGKQSVSYVTFGSLVLPIVKQPFVTISIDVWGINHKTIRNLFLPALSTIEVDILPSDCSTVVKARIFGCLREQNLIAPDARFNANEMRIGNICIGNNNLGGNDNKKNYDNDNDNNNNGNSKQWVQYFDHDGEDCNLSVMQHPFAVLPSSDEQKTDTQLCNVMLFAVADDCITNKFVYKYHQLLSFIDGQVYTGSELLFVVGLSVQNSTMILGKILLNGKFVEDSKSYAMNANRVRFLVAVEKLRTNKRESPASFVLKKTLGFMKYMVHPSAGLVIFQAIFAGDNNGDQQKRIMNDLRSGFAAKHSSFRSRKTTPENMNNISCCLEEYFTEHLELLPSACTNFNCLSNMFLCSTGIAYAPTNLFIKLERSVEKHQKNEALVKYSGTDALIIPMVSSSNSIRDNSQKYGLYGVCCHVGGRTQYGHYFAHVKSLENDQWYEADDSSVEKEHANRVKTSSAIVLLYTKSMSE